MKNPTAVYLVMLGETFCKLTTPESTTFIELPSITSDILTGKTSAMQFAIFAASYGSLPVTVTLKTSVSLTDDDDIISESCL